jgi:two-component system C4-dicarboxylate transport sensor histidine kinase DctB
VSKAIFNPKLSRWLVGAAIIAAVGFGALLLVDRTMTTRAIAEEQLAARDDALLLATSLTSELDKFSLLPLALAKDPQVGAVIAGAAGEAHSLDLRLQTLASQSNAAAIYVMNRNGRTLAASNWNLPTSFVGSNYAFRDYFRAAMRDGSSTQFALGTVSRKPGLYIAASVGPASAPAGIVAVKVEFDRTEANWRRTTRGVYVTDGDGVVLLASAEDWRFRIASIANSINRNRANDEQQFGRPYLLPLAPQLSGLSEEVVQVPVRRTQQNISPVGWDLHLVLDPGPRIAAAVATGRLTLTLVFGVLVALVFTALLIRRRRFAREEAIVAERTETLREQLSQANRLATLGQISAGVNHEIGQPVAALRVFAESGEKLVAAGESEQASANFREIMRLADRIGRITGELRRFSKRQPGETRVVAIGEILDGALLLLRDRIDPRGSQIILPDESRREAKVAAEHVRLEQVLVNLLQNALDATDQEDWIAIEIEPDGGQLHVGVVDGGEGIPAGEQDKLFQPFATSKEDGLGLGLVISRDIMRDIGGDLQFERRRDATCFTMIIPLAS